MTTTRRRFLGIAGAAVVLAACGDRDSPSTGSATSSSTTGAAPTTVPDLRPVLDPVDHGTPVGPDPFGLGVASGDPDHNSVVLWTWVDRSEAASVVVEMADDAAFTRIRVRDEVVARPDAGSTARILVTGLPADAEHWYRFVLDGHVTPPARTRTAPASGTAPVGPLRMGQVSCQRYSDGHFTVLADLAAADLDLVLHCGDYIYESEIGDVRPVDDRPPATLEEYRAVWRRYRGDADLQAAHASAPWVCAWDDHEVENNYQGATPGDPPDGDAFLAQRAAAYRAWWEFTPTRVRPPDGPSLRMYRSIDWGDLARLVVLDTRQYRDDQPCPGTLGADVGPRCDATETTTMLGPDQEAWLDETAVGHGATWTPVLSSVVVQQWRFLGGNSAWNLDQWDGYTGARKRLKSTLARASDPIVLSGDVHSSWAGTLRADPDDADSAPVAVEFVAPAVSSALSGRSSQAAALVPSFSPEVTWSETTRRGWVLHEVTGDRWQATYLLADQVHRPGGTISAERTWTVDRDARILQ